MSANTDTAMLFGVTSTGTMFHFHSTCLEMETIKSNRFSIWCQVENRPDSNKMVRGVVAIFVNTEFPLHNFVIHVNRNAPIEIKCCKPNEV